MIILSGCANLVSNFDQNTYDSASNLKVESMALAAKADQPVIYHTQEISQLQAKLTAQLAYEEGKGKSNKISYEQWKILVSPDNYLLGALLKEWSEGKPLSTPYVKEKTEQIGKAFDEILKLEGAKTK